MDRIKQAAIIMLGMGERYAAEILKMMDPKEVEAIIDTINKIDNISDEDVFEALNSFFQDSINNDGINVASKEMFKNSMASVIESKKFGNMSDSVDNDRMKWLDVLKLQSPDMIYSVMQNEHPQVIAVVTSMIISGEKSSAVLKLLAKDLRVDVVMRMACMGAVSSFAMESLAILFERELQTKEVYSDISVDGVETVANIVSYFDADNEKELFDGITAVNSELSVTIQEKMIPFDRLAQLDGRSLQILLSEVSNDDLVLALKGTDAYVKNAFLQNMASKSADILRDELESKGPVKISAVAEAQKRIINLAKKLADEEKIMLSTKPNSGVIY